MLQVFKRPLYMALALACAFLFYALVAWIPLAGLLSPILSDPLLTVSAKLILAVQLLASAFIDLSATDLLYNVFLSALIGIDIALLVFYFKTYGGGSKASVASGMAGLTASVLGFGCAACGSLFAVSLIASIFGVTLAVSENVALVLRVIGITLLLLSIWQLSRSINAPHTCPID